MALGRGLEHLALEPVERGGEFAGGEERPAQLDAGLKDLHGAGQVAGVVRGQLGVGVEHEVGVGERDERRPHGRPPRPAGTQG